MADILMKSPTTRILRDCFREPVAEVYQAAAYLDVAAWAHISGDRKLASHYIARANMSAVREWTESLWGSRCDYRSIVASSASTAVLVEAARRMPDTSEKFFIRERDGFHCRFCNVPLIRPEVRSYLARQYPEALPWGSRNIDQHAAFQAMWLQYDHVLPHSKGGSSDPSNVVLTCAPCNYCRMEYTLEEVGISDPFVRPVIQSSWDGLERVVIAS